MSVPRSEVTVLADGNDLIQIKWEQADVRSSKFPDPLVTVDYALDGRPIAITLVGDKAQQIIDVATEVAESQVWQLTLEFALDVVALVPKEHGEEILKLGTYKRLKETIMARRGKITSETDEPSDI